MASEEVPDRSSQNTPPLPTSTPPITASNVVSPPLTDDHENLNAVDVNHSENPVPEPPRPLANTHPISINSLGCHDFDQNFDPNFSFRKKKSKGNRLIKKGRDYNHRSSSAIMSSEIGRASSDSELSLMQRIGSIFSGSSRPSTPKPASPPLFEKDKPLPTERIALQNRLNYHIIQLDTWKMHIKELNVSIRKAHEALITLWEYAQACNDPELHLQVEYQADGLEAMRMARNHLRTVIEPHRAQLAKICAVRVKRNEEAGLGPKVPQIFIDLWTDDQWDEVFSV